MSNSYLPKDLLIPVFVSLLPKSPGRFKCVSKSWNALISSQEFMKLHQKQVISIEKKPNIIIVSRIPDVNRPRKEACYQQIHLLEYSTTGGGGRGGGENKELSSKIQLLDHPFDYLNLGPWLEARMVGSCNGLLCQFLRRPPNGEYDIFLCNPLTKSLWNLPQRPVVVNDDGTSTNKLLSFCGFGYDDFHHDYKVMVAGGPHYYLVNGYDYEYQIYSLRYNAWSIVRSSVDVRDHLVDDIYAYDTYPGVFVNCALHWVVMKVLLDFFDEQVIFSILAFDLRTNKNMIFQVPDKIHQEHTFPLCTLSVMNGCLVLNMSDPTPCNDVDLWVMNEYGLTDSWTMITIHNPPLLRSLSLVALLVEDNHKGKLILYNPCNGTILSYDLFSYQILEFPASPRLGNAEHMFQFVGSLIQPHPESHPPSSEYKKAYRLDMKTYAEPQGRNPKKRANPNFD